MPAAVAALDPITMEVVRHKLEGIANEMQSTLLRSSFSPIVKEGWTPRRPVHRGRQTLAQACAIPIHLATLIPVVRRVIETFPPATMQPGDIYLMNDPYLGGTHLPDIAIIQPVLRRRPADRVRGDDDPSPGHGRHDAGIGADQRDRDVPGGLRIPLLKFRDARRAATRRWWR